MIQDLGQPIAYGRTAEIYPWSEGQIVKLFYGWFERENVEKEAQLSRVIYDSGIPSPAVGEILSINNRLGLVYERILGVSMWKAFQHKPWNIIRYERRCAELQAMVHSTTVEATLPSQRETLETNIQHANALPKHLQAKMLTALKAMPDGDCLCHGDFWPGNILLTNAGEMIIDWIHASRGNPLADIARTTNLLLGFVGTSQAKRPFLSYGSSRSGAIKNSILQAFCRIYYPVYLKYYFSLHPGDKSEYLRWLPIIAAARLSDSIPELENMLIAQVEKSL